MKNRVFKYCKGAENEVVVEKRNYVESLFKEQYIQALQSVINFLEKPKDKLPNLVAFCGDRGEGKTSCMMSVSYIIENCKKEKITEELETLGFDQGNKLKDFDFEKIPIIDPAFFDKEHNIIELLLGHMYKKFKEFREHETEGIYVELNNVAKLFQKVKACLLHIGQSKIEMYDPLEELEVLSAGVELSNCLSSLVENYLKLFGKNKLLICIDDIDLNMSRAYRMCEEIRKYLNNKHCLILMSVKIEQLVEAVENAIHKDANFPDSIDFGGMSSKYVDKLIPVTARVNMPHAYDLCDYKLKVYKRIEENEGELLYESSSVKNGVVRKIFSTSRFLFYNSKGSVSLIVPNNLRGLAQLLGLLFSMQDIDDVKGRDIAEVRENNKNLFKAYFYKSWVKQLKRDDQDFVIDLTMRQDGNDLNKYVIKYLTRWMKELIDNDNQIKDVKDDQIKNIVKSSNYGYNISMGDVLYLVSYLEQSSVDEELHKVLFFIKSFYSIKLCEKYDAITNNVSVELYPKKVSDGNIYRADALFEHTNFLQRFVAGSYFTYNPDDLLAPVGRGWTKQHRDYGVLNGKCLNDLLSALGKMVKEGAWANFSAEEQEMFKLKFRMAEYFILTIARNVEQRTIRESKDGVNTPALDRSEAYPTYLSMFNSSMGYYVFDVLAIFYSMTNPQYAYTRFTDIADLYDTAIKSEWSLLRQMIEVVRKKELCEEGVSERERERGRSISITEENLNHWKWRLLSNAIVRNSEVALAMIENCKYQRRRARESGVSRELIANLYKTIIESGMVTYNRGENVEPYYIIFDFLRPICDLLRDKRISDDSEVAGQVLPSFEQIYLYNVTNKSGLITDLFEPSLHNFRQMKGSNVINRIRKSQPKLYDMVDARIWQNWFDANIKYSRDAVLQILQQHIAEFNGGEMSGIDEM